MKNDLFEQTLAATDWEKPDPAWRELVVERAVPKPRRRTGKTVWAAAACWGMILGLKVATPKEDIEIVEWPVMNERQHSPSFEERQALLAHLDYEMWEPTNFNERRDTRF